MIKETRITQYDPGNHSGEVVFLETLFTWKGWKGWHDVETVCEVFLQDGCWYWASSGFPVGDPARARLNAVTVLQRRRHKQSERLAEEVAERSGVLRL